VVLVESHGAYLATTSRSVNPLIFGGAETGAAPPGQAVADEVRTVVRDLHRAD
jgi:hypothetical protein